MLKRRLAFLLGGACVVLGFWFISDNFFSDPPAEKDLPYQAGQNATVAGNAEESLDQSLRSISLSQGEGGFELWRLKAEWANVMQQGEKIIVEKPRLTYFNKEEKGNDLYVNSDMGDIEQKSQILRFINNVSIMQEDKHMIGDLLIYNGTAKTMTFPGGARLTGSGMNGTAAHIVWDIDKKLIFGTGGIDIFFQQGKGDSSPD